MVSSKKRENAKGVLKIRRMKVKHISEGTFFQRWSDELIIIYWLILLYTRNQFGIYIWS